MKKRNLLFMYFCIAAFCLFMITPAQAVPYSFYGISHNDPDGGDVIIGETQIFVNVSDHGVTDAGINQVLFTFTNTGPEASSICDVYFDDGPLFGIASIINGPGVSFTQPADPENLPEGNTIGFDTTESFSVDSDAPAALNGVNPGESLGIVFELQSEMGFNDVITALQMAEGEGSLRIGIHVQGFADGESEAFVNNPDPVPEPSTYLLILIGMLGIISVKVIRKS